MPRGYRSIIAAAFGWLALAGASPPQQQSQHANSAANPNPPTPPDAPYSAYSKRNSDACYEAQNHDSADLCAQWRAAIAAEKTAELAKWGNIIGAVGAVLSFLSVVLVLFALGQGRAANRLTMGENARNTLRALTGAKETAEALRHAQEGSSATAALVKVSEDTARRQLRAYLDFDGIGWTTDPGRDTEKEVFVGVCYAFKNYGKTPARQVVGKVTYAAGGPGMPEKFAGWGEDEIGMIAPSDHITKNGSFLMPKWLWDAVGKRKAVFHATIEATYTDDFDVPHMMRAKFVSNATTDLGFVPGSTIRWHARFRWTHRG